MFSDCNKIAKLPTEDERREANYKSYRLFPFLLPLIGVGIMYLIFSCSKSEMNSYLSLTYEITTYDHTWKPLSVRRQLHTHRIYDPEKYRNLRPDTVCGRFEVGRWVIETDKCFK